MTPTISNIRIYPIKSLDPVEVKEADIGKSSLLHDREFAMINKDRKFISGKFTSKVNTLRSAFDLENSTVTFNEEGSSNYMTFNLEEDNENLEKYLTDFFGMSVTIIRNDEGKFQDVPVIGGITILSDATLKSLTEHFPGITLDKMRNRFRANIEITNVEAFWEDNLFAEPGSVIEFKINDVTLFGIDPRERCIVPTRDPFTGDTYPKFTKEFVRIREHTLPGWSKLRDYGHYYYLTVDTFIPDTEKGKVIRLGDELKIIGKKELSILNI
ncbi:MAG: MOSC N-terminal beta barrel domain-containing protein [Ignavibacteria bacterium]|nr:MOSC N-terminal beta barrel domain-containing protein [Ignavibacteria bacterium]